MSERALCLRRLTDDVSFRSQRGGGRCEHVYGTRARFSSALSEVCTLKIKRGIVRSCFAESKVSQTGQFCDDLFALKIEGAFITVSPRGCSKITLGGVLVSRSFGQRG